MVNICMHLSLYDGLYLYAPITLLKLSFVCTYPSIWFNIGMTYLGLYRMNGIIHKDLHCSSSAHE